MIIYLIYIPTLLLLLSLIIVGFQFRNSSQVSKYFLYSMTLVFFWLSFVFIADTTSSDDLTVMALRIGGVFSSFVPVAIYYFLSGQSSRMHVSRIDALTMLLVSTVFALLYQTDLILKEVVAGPPANIVDSGALYVLYLIYIYSLIGTGAYMLWRDLDLGYVNNKISAKISLLGVAVTAIINLVFTALLDLLGAPPELFLVSVSSFAFMGIMFFYAIYNNTFFDIKRSALFKALYIVCFAVMYATMLVVLVWLTYIYIGSNTAIAVELFVAGALVVPANRLFSEATKKVFLQDTYKTWRVLDRLADALINQDNLDKLLEETLYIYSKALKPSYSYSGAILNKDIVAESFNGNDDLRLTSVDINKIDHQWRVRTVHELPASRLKKKLEKHGFEVISTTERDDMLNGIFMFGPKQTGTPYTKQDMNLLLTSGKNLALAIENARRFREIENFNLILKEEVRIATKKLRQSNEKLKTIDKSKDDFISMASHQLRTPLTAIKNLTLLLNNERFGHINKQQEKALFQSYTSTERMVLLVEELLNVSRINAGTFEVVKSKSSLKSLIKDIVGQSVPFAAMKEIKLNSYLPAKDRPVNMDSTKIKEVLNNFLDNAIQYSDEESEVAIKMHFDGGFAVVEIVDHGNGIPLEEQKKIFSKFFRTKYAKSARPDGTGLGLYIAKKVIDDHGGEIIFKTEYGLGSTFGFKIPIK